MFGRPLTLFTWCGFAIRLDASWLLLAALVAWSLGFGYFPEAAPGRPPWEYGVMALAGVVGLGASVVVHELAHALVGRRHGIRFGAITLFLFGGIAELAEEPPTPQGEWRMALAGPLVSLAVAAAVLGGAWALDGGGAPAVLAVLSYLGFLNLLLAAFNLVPAFPLDGGRVLRAALWAWRGDLVWATRQATRMGGMLGLVLMALGLWQAAIGNTLAGAWWLVVGLFVRAAAAHTWRQQLAGLRPGIARLMAPPVTLEAGMAVERALREVVEPQPHAFYPVVDTDGRLLGGVEAATLTTLAGSGRRVGEVMRPCGAGIIGEGADPAQALARMQRSGRTRLMVTRGGRLVGVLALADLLPELKVRAERTGGGNSAVIGLK